MSSVSAYNPPLYARAVWKDGDEVRSSQVDVLAVLVDGEDSASGEGRVWFVCATDDPDRRTVWAYAEDVTIEPRIYRNAGR